jgi:hypothetical protein
MVLYGDGHTVGDADDGNRYKTEQHCRGSRLNAGVKDLDRLMISMLVKRATWACCCATTRNQITCEQRTYVRCSKRIELQCSVHAGKVLKYQDEHRHEINCLFGIESTFE